MKKFLMAILLFLVPCSLFLTGCGGEKEKSAPIVKTATFTDEYKAEDTWLVYWYLCGTDLETQGGAASADFQEILNVKLPDNVKVLIQTGGTNQWQNNVVTSGAVERYLYDANGLQRVESLPDADMGDANTLADFVRYGAQIAADHRVFVFWDHGGGSVEKEKSAPIVKTATFTDEYKAEEIIRLLK